MLPARTVHVCVPRDCYLSFVDDDNNDVPCLNMCMHIKFVFSSSALEFSSSSLFSRSLS